MEELTPKQYFEQIKGRKHKTTDEQLAKVYENCMELLNKYRITGQKEAIKKLIFHTECIEKERELVKMGIDTFIYRDDIEEYIDNIAKDVVKLIELENYEREIPDEIVETIAQVKDIFDGLYIVFTDYTGKSEKLVEEKRREKDPILFGVFRDTSSRTVIDRFYYLGDWEDEFCDLTLDKMVNETKRLGKRNIAKTISTPSDIKQLKEQLRAINRVDGNFVVTTTDLYDTKPSFFKNIKSALKKGI